jgi:hypothetical protein
VTVTLINKTRRMKIYNLPHETYCKALGQCVCVSLPGRDKKAVCSSLTLPAGATVSGLSDAVLLVTTIAKDINAGVLQVKKVGATSGEPSAFNQEDTKQSRKKGKSQKTEGEAVPMGGET